MFNWKKEKPYVAPERKKAVARFKVVAEQAFFPCLMHKTYIYMKNGDRYIAVFKNKAKVTRGRREVCLVTGQAFQYDVYEWDTIKAELLTAEYDPHSIQTYEISHPYRDGPFTRFKNSKGDTVSVRTEDIDRMVEKPPTVWKQSTFLIGELEEIK